MAQGGGVEGVAAEGVEESLYMEHMVKVFSKLYLSRYFGEKHV